MSYIKFLHFQTFVYFGHIYINNNKEVNDMVVNLNLNCYCSNDFCDRATLAIMRRSSRCPVPSLQLFVC